MSQPTWQQWLVDINGSVLADLSLLGDMTIAYPRKGQVTLAGKIPLTSDAALAVTDGCYIKAYRTPVGGSIDAGSKALRFYGMLEVDEVQGQDGLDLLALTAFSPDVILDDRFTSTSAFASVATDRGVILKTLIDTTNGDGETGIRTNTSNLQTTSNTTVDYSSNAPSIGSVIGDYSDALDGCDCEFRPIEYTGGKIADLYVYADRGNLTNTGVEFGYGDGTQANCLAMGSPRNRRALKNYVSAKYGNSLVIPSSSSSATSIATNLRREAQLNLTGETSDTEALQQASGYLAQHVSSSRIAEYSVTTGPRAPRLWDDFNVGDVVTLNFRKGIAFTATPRIENVTISISDEGVETTSQIQFRTLAS